MRAQTKAEIQVTRASFVPERGMLTVETIFKNKPQTLMGTGLKDIEEARLYLLSLGLEAPIKTL